MSLQKSLLLSVLMGAGCLPQAKAELYVQGLNENQLQKLAQLISVDPDTAVLEVMLACSQGEACQIEMTNGEVKTLPLPQTNKAKSIKAIIGAVTTPMIIDSEQAAKKVFEGGILKNAQMIMSAMD